MGEEIYFKTVIDLSANEMMLIYDRHQDCQYPMPIPRFDKTGIVLNLANLMPNFLLMLEKKYVFRKIGKNLKYDPDYEGEAVQKKARADHVLNIEKINDLIMMNDLDSILAKIKEESDDSKETQSSTGTSQTDPAPGPANPQNHGPASDSAPKSATGPAPKTNFGHAQAPNGKSNTTPQSGSAPTYTAYGHYLNKPSGSQFRLKLPKFSSELPIENWICALEIYMACYNLSEEDIIKISLSQLLAEDSGTSLIESINAEERKNWKAFKSKLMAILGKDQEHFKHLYNTFQRGSESQAMALTKLIAFFKKGYKKTALDDADNSIVCEKFIDAQEPRLRELLTREKSRLNVSNIAGRATELERSLFKKETIFTAEETPIARSELSELCSQLKSFVSNAVKDQTITKNKRGRIDTKKIEGHCIAFVKKGKCRFGSKCRYLHSSDIPKHIRDIITNEE